MKVLLLFALVVAPALGALIPPLRFGPKRIQPPSADKETVQLWYEQSVDHFKPMNERKFNQKYFVRNQENYVAGSPIFLFLGGEWDVNGGFISSTSFVGKMIDEWSGIGFELEHRYYGESLPVENFDTYNLEFLSIDQALADIANFAVAMNEAHNLTGPWIICGTSYSGMLAGFARQKYSHIFHAAYSSSGQMEGKVDFFEYHEMTGAGLAKVDFLCPGYLSAAMDEFVSYIEGQDPADLAYVVESFNICNSSDLTKVEDAQYLYSLVANSFASVVQFAFPQSIQTECDLLINGEGTPLKNLADVIKRIYPADCLFVDYFEIIKFYITLTEPFPGNNFRQYIYQTCTEFGWFFTLSGKTPFGNVVPLEFFMKTCKDVFGFQFRPEFLEAGVARMNLEFGGKNPDVDRVLYTHGTFDGWTKVAAEESFGPDAIVINIEDVGHAADMFYFENDPPQLIAARDQISIQLRKWIDEYKK